ncbi:MAG: hypothetical protein N2C14_02875, partial [Planctomycetales bacterium]
GIHFVGPQDVAMAEAHRILMRSAIAVAKYRNATGDYPETIADLVPDYLAEIPIDPFDGNTIRMINSPGGFVLYIVGPDLIDDKARKEYENLASGGDVTFTFDKVYLARVQAAKR